MPDRPQYDDVQVGDELPARTVPIRREHLVRYAGASGDFTSFHYDVDRAHAMGHDTLFAMGMLAAGHLGTMAASVLAMNGMRKFR